MEKSIEASRIPKKPRNHPNNRRKRPAAWRAIVKVMKLSTALILIAVLHLSATGLAQKVNFNGTNVPLMAVFNAIENQLGYGVLISHKLQEASLPVTIKVEDGSLDDLLQKSFAFQPFKLAYTITGHTIYISEVATLVEQSKSTTSQPVPVKISGMVLTELGQVLAGANITIRETGKGTVTNAKGEFVLDNVPINSTIIVSFIGYAPQVIDIKGAIDLKIYLKVTKNQLDKVVVQAYGATTQRLTTGNIATVSAEEIERQPISNPLEALQGRVAGLNVTQNNGFASAPYTVEIRGRNSINTSLTSDPLYIIDGVPLTISEVGGGVGGSYTNPSPGFLQNGFLGPAGGQSPFFSINPADIESIEVLKDADATAIYGSRGANGVILVTTKRGKPGKTKFDLNAYEGINEVTRHWDMLNTSEYLQVRREAFKNDGIRMTTANAPDLLVWDTTRSTNWQNYLWGNVGKAYDIQAALSGGDPRTTFRLAGGFHSIADITTVKGASQRGSFSADLTHKTTDQRFSINFKATYTYAVINMINLQSSTAVLPPDAPAAFDKNGNLNYAQYDVSNVNLPFANLEQPYRATTSWLNSRVLFGYEIIKGLVAKVEFGYNNAENSQTQIQPIVSLDPKNNPTGNSLFGQNKNTTWALEPTLEYNNAVGQGKLNILIGGSSQNSSTDGLFVAGSGYTNDALLRTISNAPVQAASDNYGQYRYAAIFGRANYNWRDKLIINANGRRDGSSRFGPGKQFGNFGSIGLAYIFSEEEWAKKTLKFLSFGKIRSSYGITGSDIIQDYQYLSRWTSQGYLPYNGVTPLIPIQFSDSNFHWQVNRKAEIALDLGFLNDRITFEAAYYRDRCNNQLIPFPTPLFSGFASVTANSPANVQNSGTEFQLDAKLINLRNFRWTANFNIGINRNKLLSYPNLTQSPYADLLKIGQPLNITYQLHYKGVDPLTGQYAFEDRNHDGAITVDYSVVPGTNDDDRFQINLTPKYFGGFGNTFEYKNLAVTLFFYFKKQMGTNAFTGEEPGIMKNQSVEILNHWSQPGDQTPFAKPTTRPGITTIDYAVYSDAGYTDASYIRLKNATITYNLSELMAKKAGIQKMGLFLRGENLFVITKYKGIDPETQNFGLMPPNKIITGGVSFTF